MAQRWFGPWCLSRFTWKQQALLRLPATRKKETWLFKRDGLFAQHFLFSSAFYGIIATWLQCNKWERSRKRSVWFREDYKSKRTHASESRGSELRSECASEIKTVSRSLGRRLSEWFPVEPMRKKQNKKNTSAGGLMKADAAQSNTR